MPTFATAYAARAPASLSRQSRGQRTRRDRWRSTRPIEKVSPSDGTGPTLTFTPAGWSPRHRHGPSAQAEHRRAFPMKVHSISSRRLASSSSPCGFGHPARTLRRHTLEICDLPLAACLNHRSFAAVCAGRLRYEREFLERSRSHMKSATSPPIRSPLCCGARSLLGRAVENELDGFVVVVLAMHALTPGSSPRPSFSTSSSSTHDAPTRSSSPPPLVRGSPLERHRRD